MSMTVTQIISDIYPFREDTKRVWIDSINKEMIELGKSPVSYDSLMTATQIIGDIVHTYFIERAMGFPSRGLPDEFKMFEQPIKDCIAQYQIEGLLCEFNVKKADEYEGHPDLLVMKTFNGKRIKALCDVKTYGLYRYVLGLPKKEMAKLNGQKSKVSLQTSMYKDALMFSPEIHVSSHWNVSHLFCYHVKEDGVDVVELPYNVTPYLEWLKTQNK